MKGIGVPINRIGEKLYYERTEIYFYEKYLVTRKTFQQWKQAKAIFTEKITKICMDFEELTNPLTPHKPELIPIIAWMRRSLDKELSEKFSS